MKYLLDLLEAFSPDSDLFFDFEPFFLVHLSDHGGLDDYLLIQLVHLCIDDTVTHGLDDPLFNFIFVDVEECCDLGESLLLFLSLVLICYATNLNVLLLQNGFLHGNTLVRKKLLLFLNFAFEIEDVFL